MRLISCLLPLLFCLSTSLHAEPIRVGITEVPPFVMQNDAGEWEGISIDLWRQIAGNLELEYELVPMSFSDLLDGARTGSVDVAVGALTMTAEREAEFDFTHPFYQTGLAIGVPREDSPGILRSLGALLSWQFLSLVAGLALLLLLVGSLLWLVERRRNTEQFGGTPAQGIGASFWWAAVTMTTVGYGDKAPVTLAGRLIALVWMFAGLIMVASFTAAITSALTVSNLQRQINGPRDLPGFTVATVADTASAEYLTEQRIDQARFPDLTSAMRAVAADEADAVVYDRPLMQHRNRELGDQRLDILSNTFSEQLYAFALPSGSQLRGPLAQEVLRVTESAEWQSLLDRYLGRR
ncbi:amino acid ABC transporter substrate-binding protein, PAAT family [Halopseudomonas xinjiangensis]|uniref:Amino acid ABC transporter substrate-binding protein, PAAT family n=1 Tax=Halopseudomonas xinjiangensis TaxID=487184 RepID=A0A1H1YFE4_9GAMM|nr:transporter substrate-binding domain-containing protein [Halopseudomonas xinjiangensis]SDT19979.1 amino acid ABC transporter substrate-binding protein, PAAT family [Halopseudomonas xinjiangensis]